MKAPRFCFLLSVLVLFACCTPARDYGDGKITTRLSAIAKEYLDADSASTRIVTNTVSVLVHNSAVIADKVSGNADRRLAAEAPASVTACRVFEYYGDTTVNVEVRMAGGVYADSFFFGAAVLNQALRSFSIVQRVAAEIRNGREADAVSLFSEEALSDANPINVKSELRYHFPADMTDPPELAGIAQAGKVLTLYVNLRYPGLSQMYAFTFKDGEDRIAGLRGL